MVWAECACGCMICFRNDSGYCLIDNLGFHTYCRLCDCISSFARLVAIFAEQSEQSERYVDTGTSASTSTDAGSQAAPHKHDAVHDSSDPSKDRYGLAYAPQAASASGESRGRTQGLLSGKGVWAGLGQGRGLAVIEEERERWGGGLREQSSNPSRGEDSKYSENPELPLGDDQLSNDQMKVQQREEEEREEKEKGKGEKDDERTGGRSIELDVSARAVAEEPPMR